MKMKIIQIDRRSEEIRGNHTEVRKWNPRLVSYLKLSHLSEQNFSQWPIKWTLRLIGSTYANLSSYTVWKREVVSGWGESDPYFINFNYINYLSHRCPIGSRKRISTVDRLISSCSKILDRRKVANIRLALHSRETQNSFHALFGRTTTRFAPKSSCQEKFHESAPSVGASAPTM